MHLLANLSSGHTKALNHLSFSHYYSKQLLFSVLRAAQCVGRSFVTAVVRTVAQPILNFFALGFCNLTLPVRLMAQRI